MTPRVFWWNYPTLEQKITFSQCRKFLRALSSFAPVRRGGKSYRADHNFFAALRLCAKKNPPRRTRNSAGQALRLGEKKKKRIARKDAKPQRPPEGRQARWNHASLEMIKNQLKVWVNPKAKLHCIKVHFLGD